MGGKRMIVSEPLAGRRAAAERVGASHVVEPKDLVTTAFALSEGNGAEMSVDASGLPVGIGDSVNATARGGRNVLAGGSEQQFPLDIFRSIIKEPTDGAGRAYTRAEVAES